MEGDIKAKLVDLEFEIKSLELQLQRAQAQREHLLQQLKSAPTGGSSRRAPAKLDPYQSSPETTGPAAVAAPEGQIRLDVLDNVKLDNVRRATP
jgi:hypothetical protein